MDKSGVAKINSAVFMRKNKMFWTKECSIQLGYRTIYILHATSRHASARSCFWPRKTNLVLQNACCWTYTHCHQNSSRCGVDASHVHQTLLHPISSISPKRKFYWGSFVVFYSLTVLPEFSLTNAQFSPLSSSLCSFALLCLKIIVCSKKWVRPTDSDREGKWEETNPR